MLNFASLDNDQMRQKAPYGSKYKNSHGNANHIASHATKRGEDKAHNAHQKPR